MTAHQPLPYTLPNCTIITTAVTTAAINAPPPPPPPPDRHHHHRHQQPPNQHADPARMRDLRGLARRDAERRRLHQRRYLELATLLCQASHCAPDRDWGDLVTV